MLLNQIISKMDSLASTAMGMVTALAWNSAFKQFFDSHPVLKSYGPWVYAFIVTIIAVLYVTILNKVQKSELSTIDRVIYKKHHIKTQEEEHR